jgi:hypothetical protein
MAVDPVIGHNPAELQGCRDAQSEQSSETNATHAI